MQQCFDTCLRSRHRPQQVVLGKNCHLQHVKNCHQRRSWRATESWWSSNRKTNTLMMLRAMAHIPRREARIRMAINSLLFRRRSQTRRAARHLVWTCSYPLSVCIWIDNTNIKHSCPDETNRSRPHWIRSENAENDLAVKHGVCARNRDSELIANAEEEQRADHDQRLQLKQELAEARSSSTRHR